MAQIRPFQCSTREELVSRIAALPYDVINREEAKKKSAGNLFLFEEDRAETQFDDTVDTYDARVYERQMRFCGIDSKR